MKKTLLFLTLALLIAIPVLAQVSFEDGSSSYGQVKTIKVTGVNASESGGTATIAGSNFTPAALSPAFTITATTDTGNIPPTGSTTTATGTAGTKTGAVQINFTGEGGNQQTGWLRIYSSGQ